VLCRAGIDSSGLPTGARRLWRREGIATVEFQHDDGSAIAVSNRSGMQIRDDEVLDGIVLWTGDVPRPNGWLMHTCPGGDVTGAEIEAGTVWQGVVYAVTGDGQIGLLPAEGEAATRQLLLPDLAGGLQNASALAGIARQPCHGMSSA
jgi:hypothetical protein